MKFPRNYRGNSNLPQLEYDVVKTPASLPGSRDGSKNGAFFARRSRVFRYVERREDSMIFELEGSRSGSSMVPLTRDYRYRSLFHRETKRITTRVKSYVSRVATNRPSGSPAFESQSRTNVQFERREIPERDPFLDFELSHWNRPSRPGTEDQNSSSNTRRKMNQSLYLGTYLREGRSSHRLRISWRATSEEHDERTSVFVASNRTSKSTSKGLVSPVIGADVLAVSLRRKRERTDVRATDGRRRPSRVAFPSLFRERDISRSRGATEGS